MAKSKGTEYKQKKELNKISKLSNKDYVFYSTKLASLRKQIKFLQQKEQMLLKLREECSEEYKEYMVEYRKKRKKEKMEDGQIRKGKKTP